MFYMPPIKYIRELRELPANVGELSTSKHLEMCTIILKKLEEMYFYFILIVISKVVLINIKGNVM
jgi:hypothetical protein